MESSNRETADEGRDRAVIRIRGSWDLSKKAGHGCVVRCFVFNCLLKPEIILKWRLEAVECHFKLALIDENILTGQILLSHWNSCFSALWGEMKQWCVTKGMEAA